MSTFLASVVALATLIQMLLAMNDLGYELGRSETTDDGVPRRLRIKLWLSLASWVLLTFAAVWVVIGRAY